MTKFYLLYTRFLNNFKISYKTYTDVETAYKNMQSNTKSNYESNRKIIVRFMALQIHHFSNFKR